VVAAAFALSVAAAYGAYVAAAGGWLAMWSVMRDRGEVYEDVKFLGWILDLSSVPLLLFVVARSRSKRFPRWLIILCAVNTVLIAATGDRSRALVPALMVIIFCHYYFKRIRVAWLFAAGLIVMFLATGLREMRKSSHSDGGVDLTVLEDGMAEPTEILEEFYLSRRTIDFVSLLFYIMPDDLPFQYGMTYVRALAMPIPRALWPDKPLVDEAGLVGRALLGDEYYGLPVGTEGVLYLNFHLPGVLLGMFLVGLIHRRVYVSFAASLPAPGGIVLYAVALYSMYVFTGIGLFSLAVLVVPTWLALRLSRRSRGTADAALNARR
jgi:hypothetical protein